jgi:hypothetical protein
MKSISGTPVKMGITDSITISKKQRRDKFGFIFDGYIKIEKEGIYTFFIQSDDGSKLYIDDKEIVDNDGDHGNQEKEGRAALKKGYHRLKVLYFDSGGDNNLKALMQPAGGKKEELSPRILSH